MYTLYKAINLDTDCIYIGYTQQDIFTGFLSVHNKNKLLQESLMTRYKIESIETGVSLEDVKIMQEEWVILYADRELNLYNYTKKR